MKVIRCRDKAEVGKAACAYTIQAMMQPDAHIAITGGSTPKEMYEYLIRVASQPKKHVLTDVLLETLSIIAYKQPVTKLEIEKIRGVKSDHAVNKLVEYNLVCERGRLDAPGKPILFGTTEEFLRRFSIHSLDDLPSPNPEQVESFKEEAEEEVQLKLDI